MTECREMVSMAFVHFDLWLSFAQNTYRVMSGFFRAFLSGGGLISGSDAPSIGDITAFQILCIFFSIKVIVQHCNK